MTTWTEQDSIDLSARLVADDGYRMPLTGPERRAAVNRMLAAGLTTEVMADRLCMDVDSFRSWTYREGIRLPRRQVAWWVVVAQPSQASANKNRRNRSSRARARAAA
ncbi:hypothetical protein ACQEVC_45650 [Plantactinospora sp. CA-294935]|uniref:hypothetical protein n=1 Tax=Plantactinospora sp. CA-294935 TaxID=3240012 RepID=UPI003D8FA319